MAVSLTFSLDFKELGCSFCQCHGGVSLGRLTGPVVQVALWACRAAVGAIWTTDGLKEVVNLCNQWLCESENSTSSNTAFPPPSCSPGPLLQLPSFMSLCAFSNWKAFEQSSGEGRTLKNIPASILQCFWLIIHSFWSTVQLILVFQSNDYFIHCNVVAFLSTSYWLSEENYQKEVLTLWINSP